MTGGACFIEGNFVPDALAHSYERVLNFDVPTYGGNLAILVALQDDASHFLLHYDIGDRVPVDRLGQSAVQRPCTVSLLPGFTP